MLEDNVKEELKFNKFVDMLKILLEEGYGEITYKIMITDKRIQLVSLTKTNTFKMENGMIKP